MASANEGRLKGSGVMHLGGGRRAMASCSVSTSFSGSGANEPLGWMGVFRTNVLLFALAIEGMSDLERE